MEADKRTKQTAANVMQAIKWLAARCDYASTNDKVGFNGTDAPIGHALAEKEIWSQRELAEGCRLASFYRKQLSDGGVNTDGIDELHRSLKDGADFTKRGRLNKRDIVQGRITVNEQAGTIIVNVGYNPNLVEKIKTLLDRRWNQESKTWTAKLCAENAAIAEEISEEWGIDIAKHDGWINLVPVRSVDIRGDRLIISGVSAKSIVNDLPKREGIPTNDAQKFSAIEIIDNMTIGFPLRSWVIRDAILWLKTLSDDSVSYKTLAWAHEEIISHFQQEYPKALIAEASRLSRSSATEPARNQNNLQSLLPAELSRRLMPHQWIAIQSITEQKQFILADQQGLGKTIEILAALEAVQAFPAIILAPATALLNWRDEAANWLPHRSIAVLGGGVGKRDQGVPLENAAIVIINYESFTKHGKELTDLKPNGLVSDEAQYLKGHDSKISKSIKEFTRETKVERIILATGTPMMNRPSELLTMLTLLPTVLAALGGFGRFAARYCQATLHKSSYNEYWDFKGSSHLDELAIRLRESGCFLRRTKDQVLPDLALKQHITQSVEISNRNEYKQAKEEFNLWLKKKNKPKARKVPASKKNDGDESELSRAADWLGWNEEEIDNLYLDESDRAEAIRQLTALRQLAGIGKVKAATEWIKKTVKDEKLVVFAFHLDVQQTLLSNLSSAFDTPVLSITGGMTSNQRQDAIQKFQSDPASRLIICSLKAAQTAITLTAARLALMVELDWTPSALEQAEDRIHRIGQSGQVTITYLHAQGTLDDRMVEILNSKREGIKDLTATNAPYGLRKDGQPRKQAAGPGRPRLPKDERERRNKKSKSGWQERNTEYMKNYMREIRLKNKIRKNEAEIKEFTEMQRIGFTGMQFELYGSDPDLYTPEEYRNDLDRARKKAERAQKFLITVKE
ncbi:MAG: DEAD/DEAH box helicase [Halothiobacillus sp.]|jgi:superfamily II DNA/RNA helicase